MRAMPPYQPPPPGPMAPHTATLALVALGAALLGVSSVQVALFGALRATPLLAIPGALCGVVGVVLGALALLRIATSGGKLEGRRMALAAMIIGALVTLADVGALAMQLLPR
jgi:hypothetical protein